MSTDNNRLLLELEKHRRDINREVINPLLPELALADLKPVLAMVAHARADYIKTLLSIADGSEGESPAPESIKELKHRRETFQELVDAVNALESVISRDYLDVKSGRSHS
ncbi:hypothetical protein [Marinobacterium stanieri]|uniref:Uncharacterized protein n=1 Tax=Marinobacterium stanieri TaxID=49186 RepID=A0A1N6V5Z4_9GAMM|nr:hypothetical protein [Marinobacterium stanieri]SIQ73240.1 hypothetical protein SAMN05421647_10857 [Marinobacterium stanieri]